MLYLILLLPLLLLIFIVIFEIEKVVWAKIQHKTCNKANQTHQTDIMPLMRDKNTLWYVLHKV